MDIKTKPTANLNVTTVRIPAGDISLDSGIRLLAEMLNDEGLIVNKKYVDIPVLPTVVVAGQETPAADFIKSVILQVIGLEEDLES